jgi:hypothetical protein
VDQEKLVEEICAYTLEGPWSSLVTTETGGDLVYPFPNSHGTSKIIAGTAAMISSKKSAAAQVGKYCGCSRALLAALGIRCTNLQISAMLVTNIIQHLLG